MDIATQKYIRKPLIVDAVEVTAENFEDLAKWCQGKILNSSNELPADEVDPGSQHIKVRVHNPISVRQTKAFVGDWILYTESGYKVYTPKAFYASFVACDSLTEEDIQEDAIESAD